MDAKPFAIVQDNEDDDLYHTECPHCGALNKIVEQDSAIRWNTLGSITPTGAIASTGDTGDFDFEQWYCTGCGSDAITEPEGFEIKDWY